MFDLLASADLLVPDASQVVSSWTERLGILPARGAWTQTWPDWGFDSRWCRVRRDLAQAPTFVEVIAPLSNPDHSIGHPHIAELAATQGDRLYKTHSIPIAVSDLDAMVERLARAGAPFRLDEPEGLLPFRRVWLGRVVHEHGPYDPRADGGLYLEFIATSDMAMPILTEPPLASPSETSLQRIAARTVLVEDLDAVLRILDRNLGWTPIGDTFETGGARRAQLGFTHVRSALIELIQPMVSDTPEGDYAARWGVGPYGMRLEVESLEAARERLRATATPFREVTSDGVEMLLPDAQTMAGPQLEIVEGSSPA